MKYKGLGKGLSALIEDTMPEDNVLLNIDIELIINNPLQPRKTFSPESLQELAESIKENGIIQPIIVKKATDNNHYEIIAGERRWRAAKIAELKEIPAILKKSERSFEMAIIENVQREDLNPIEEAEGYQRLIDEYKYTQEKVASIIGKSRSHVANILRINNLSQKIKDKILENVLTVGHAKVLVGYDKADIIVDQIIKHNLSVRQTENLIQKIKDEGKERRNPENNIEKKPVKKYNKSNLLKQDISELELMLREKLGLKVDIISHLDKGQVIIYYSKPEEFDELLEKLTLR